MNGTYFLTLRGSQSGSKEGILKGSIKLKKPDNIKWQRRFREVELSYIANESVNGTATLENW